MGFDTVTTVKSSKQELVALGSDFYNEWADFRLKNNDRADEYFCRKYYVLESLHELSKKYPKEIFTGVTWRTDEYEDCMEQTLVFKSGDTLDIRIRPKYTYMEEVHNISDKSNLEIQRLLEKFIEHLEKYFHRLDIVNDVDDYSLDYLNNHKDDEGFSSYYKIVWENDKYRFSAARKYQTLVIIQYEIKEIAEDNA
jgi:hypothetical protein